MFKHLAAWRRGRGFGVHSPLAYDLITNTLADKPAYYGDSEIERIFASPRKRRLGRIVLRLAARFNPTTMSIGGVEQTFIDIARIANPAITVSDSEPDMAIRKTDDGVMEILIHPTLSEPGTGPLVIYSLRDIRIVILRHGLTAQKINAKL